MRQELLHHANRPAQIDFNLSSDVFEASGFVVDIDLTHDAGVVDQSVELMKLFGDLFVKTGDRFRIGNVASKGVNVWKGHFRTVHLRLIAARDNNRVTKCRELFGEFVTDTAGTAGDQNRIAREFHNLIPPKLNCVTTYKVARKHSAARHKQNVPWMHGETARQGGVRRPPRPSRMT